MMTINPLDQMTPKGFLRSLFIYRMRVCAFAVLLVFVTGFIQIEISKGYFSLIMT